MENRELQIFEAIGDNCSETCANPLGNPTPTLSSQEDREGLCSYSGVKMGIKNVYFIFPLYFILQQCWYFYFPLDLRFSNFSR
jgi:hypothetical protein